MRHHLRPHRLSGTSRTDAYSDGVFAIIATLLILELKIPHLEVHSAAAVWQALDALAPKFLSFAVSFFTITIFWVNHHQFFHHITHSDWKLMWLNSHLLFWLTVLPFTTAFLGDYPDQSVVIALYATNLSLASLAFTMMGHYVFFRGKLVDPSVSMEFRKREWRRSFFAVAAFALTAVLAFVQVTAAFVLLALLPFLFVIPGLLRPATEDEPQQSAGS